jgi:predicted nuclease of predicted toxin-antitoxin system
VRLLFDEQLSEELIVLLHDIFPDSLHVRTLGAGGSGDRRVWQLAREHECVLVTKDEDFHRLSVLRGAPPKVVWVRIGNCTTQDVATLLRRREPAIRLFADQNEIAFLEIGP